jgi:hypothetical protein
MADKEAKKALKKKRGDLTTRIKSEIPGRWRLVFDQLFKEKYKMSYFTTEDLTEVQVRNVNAEIPRFNRVFDRLTKTDDLSDSTLSLEEWARFYRTGSYNKAYLRSRLPKSTGDRSAKDDQTMKVVEAVSNFIKSRPAPKSVSDKPVPKKPAGPPPPPPPGMKSRDVKSEISSRVSKAKANNYKARVKAVEAKNTQKVEAVKRERAQRTEYVSGYYRKPPPRAKK